ncbi:MAG: methyltransferase domain-containing protein [Chloroflexi bacterium]|nr:methyltransferase domain-containing protein [Chloroflexota bacterium]
MQEKRQNQNTLVQYYAFHSKIYDATRWSFLFGRTTIVRQVAMRMQPTRILEVGCGTGNNLVQLCKLFPDAYITGLDLSNAMLARARQHLGEQTQHVQLLERAYDRPLKITPSFDLILFSYALTMFNPGWEQAIDAAYRDLRPGGLIAVVDFHDTPVTLYRQWMERNHVRMTGHLLPYLTAHFQPQQTDIRPAYAGLWTYLLFIGKKKTPMAVKEAK